MLRTSIQSYMGSGTVDMILLASSTGIISVVDLQNFEFEVGKYC